MCGSQLSLGREQRLGRTIGAGRATARPDMPRENLLSLFREFETVSQRHRCSAKARLPARNLDVRRLARTAAEFARLLQERNVKTGDRVLSVGAEQRRMGGGVLGMPVARGGGGADGRRRQRGFRFARGARRWDASWFLTTRERAVEGRAYLRLRCSSSSWTNS